MRKIFIFIFGISGLVCACNNENVKVVEPVSADEQLVATLNNDMFADTSSIVQHSGTPSLWNSFEVFFRNCVKSSGMPSNGLFSKYRLLYLGPSNPRYLGAIYSSSGVEPKTELTKWLTNDELNRFIVKGVSVPSCDISLVKENFINIALGKLPVVGTDTTLKFILANKDSIVNSVGSWAIDEINTEEFLRYLNDSAANNSDIKFYKDVLLKDGNLVAFKVVKITGFQADIKLSKNLQAGVNLKVPIITTKSKAGIDSTVCSFGLNKVNNTTVHVKSEGEFYAFALAMKGKKI